MGLSETPGVVQRDNGILNMLDDYLESIGLSSDNMDRRRIITRASIEWNRRDEAVVSMPYPSSLPRLCSRADKAPGDGD